MDTGFVTVVKDFLRGWGASLSLLPLLQAVML
jgi:hypothetical protein